MSQICCKINYRAVYIPILNDFIKKKKKKYWNQIRTFPMFEWQHKSQLPTCPRFQKIKFKFYLNFYFQKIKFKTR